VAAGSSGDRSDCHFGLQSLGVHTMQAGSRQNTWPKYRSTSETEGAHHGHCAVSMTHDAGARTQFEVDAESFDEMGGKALARAVEMQTETTYDLGISWVQ
jgi:hypothetical protein